MRLMIWTNNEGPTDDMFKDGDIFIAYPDTWIPGSDETKRWLVVEISDYHGSFEELVASEYGIGAGGEAVMRRMRKYGIDYATKLTPQELADARDPLVDVPIVKGRFIASDIIRK